MGEAMEVVVVLGPARTADVGLAAEDVDIMLINMCENDFCI